MKNTEYTCYIYKCRMCGKTFSDIESGAGREHANLVNAIYNIRVDNQTPVPMQTVHECKRNLCYGIGDLIGCKSK